MYNIFIFRRDLRLYDNYGLSYIMKNYENIIPIFIFTPEQITNENKFLSHNALKFMIESINDLQLNLSKYNSKLYLFYGDNIDILTKIVNILPISNIIFNANNMKAAADKKKNILM